jgi:hypothetical protein
MSTEVLYSKRRAMHMTYACSHVAKTPKTPCLNAKLVAEAQKSYPTLTVNPILMFSTVLPPTPFNIARLSRSSTSASSISTKQFTMPSAFFAPTPFSALIWLISRELMILRRCVVRGVRSTEVCDRSASSRKIVVSWWSSLVCGRL